MEIEKKMEEKRKELRKIGSIQRLQAGSHKNIHNLSYRPTPSLVLHSNIKKSAAHVSNILLKSPSTQDEPNSSIRGKEKSGSQKKLMVSPPATVSSTPYIMRMGMLHGWRGCCKTWTKPRNARTRNWKARFWAAGISRIAEDPDSGQSSRWKVASKVIDIL